MKTMYYAHWGFSVDIKPVNVTTETEKTVTVDGSRRQKISDDNGFFDTYPQAYKFLSDKANQAVIDVEKKMKYAQAKLELVAQLAPDAK